MVQQTARFATVAHLRMHTSRIGDTQPNQIHVNHSSSSSTTTTTTTNSKECRQKQQQACHATFVSVACHTERCGAGWDKRKKTYRAAGLTASLQVPPQILRFRAVMHRARYEAALVSMKKLREDDRVALHRRPPKGGHTSHREAQTVAHVSHRQHGVDRGRGSGCKDEKTRDGIATHTMQTLAHTRGHTQTRRQG